MPMMAGSRRGEEPSRILCDTSQAPSPEHARQSGKIRSRSRSQLGFPGSGQAEAIVQAQDEERAGGHLDRVAGGRRDQHAGVIRGEAGD
jgi:hypothetical protein